MRRRRSWDRIWARVNRSAPEASVWRACFYNMVFLGVVGLIFVVLPGRMVAAFTSDEGVASNAVAALRIISAGFPFYAYAMVLTNSFNGAGDTLTPTVVNVFLFLAVGAAGGLRAGPRPRLQCDGRLLVYRGGVCRRWRSSALCSSGAVAGKTKKV